MSTVSEAQEAIVANSSRILSFAQKMAFTNCLVPGVNKLFLKLTREPSKQKGSFSCPATGWPMTTSTNRDWSLTSFQIEVTK